MTKFWEKKTGLKLTSCKCGIRGCGNAAEEGGHMWVRLGERRLTKFCFIMPICKEHNNDPYLNENYMPTKKGVMLVARYPTRNME